MGFLNNKTEKKPKDSAYFEATEEKVTVRPGLKNPVGVWVHQIHAVEETTTTGQKNTTRRYQTEICTSTGRNGAGCRLCSMKDPLWSRLTPEKQTNRKGVRADFPKKVIHIMPVKNHKLGIWQIMKGGNQTYEQMDVWYESQPTEDLKDLRRCDWVMSAEGVKMRKRYASTRLDVTPYHFTTEDESEVKRLLEKANADLAPRPAEEFTMMINGDGAEQGSAGVSGQAYDDKADVNPPWDTTPSAPTGMVTVPGPSNISGTTTADVKPGALPKPAATTVTALADFSTWLNKQPEFQGTSMIQVGIPLLKEFLGGGINYYSLPPEKISELQSFLSNKLNALRVK